MGNRQVTIKGEQRELPHFMAFKAFHAMEVISQVQDTQRAVLEAGATFKREYEANHYVEISRTEAREMFRPKPLYDEQPVTNADGEIVRDGDGDPVLAPRPLLDDAGEPVLGPDPLAHLTEEDWVGSGQAIRQSDSPPKSARIAVMVTKGFELGRTHVLRLLALALATNKELEDWDAAGTDIDHELDERGKKLLHEATPTEFMKLATAVIELCQEELADPFNELIAAVSSLGTPAPAPSDSAEEVAPMRIESDESPDSATDSAPPTTGPSGTSSTEPASVGSSPSGSD